MFPDILFFFLMLKKFESFFNALISSSERSMAPPWVLESWLSCIGNTITKGFSEDKSLKCSFNFLLSATRRVANNGAAPPVNNPQGGGPIHNAVPEKNYGSPGLATK